MAILKILASTLPLIFTTIAFAFVVVTFTTRDWAHKNYFRVGLSTTEWDGPEFTLYRSPFIRCRYDTNDSTTTTTYTVNCSRYSVYGRGKTSCESEAALNTVGALQFGDERECQQVHMSGNLILASLVFVSVAFALCLALTGYSFFAASKSSSKRNHGEAAADDAVADSHTHRHHNEKARHPRARVPVFITISAYALVIALSVSAVATLLSQFYAILGLIQSVPGNGNWSDIPGGPPISEGQLGEAPWAQGKALSIYLSLAWFFGAVGAGAVGAAWGGLLRGTGL